MSGPDFVSFFARRPEKWGPGRYGVSRHRAFTVHRAMRRGRPALLVARYGAGAPVPRRGRYLETRRMRGWRRFRAHLAALAAELS